MSKVEWWKGWTIGACVGASVMTIVCTLVAIQPMGSRLLELDNMIKECEKNMPRNMTCELKANIKESE